MGIYKDQRENGGRWKKVVAAVLLVTGLLVIFYMEVRHYPLFQHQQPANITNTPDGYTVSAPRGAQRQVTLPDGTKVWLNAATTLSYTAGLSKGDRVVDLTGEALFDVSPDPARPFRVRTGKMIVEQLGTLFNVRSYPNEQVCRTVVAEGSVKVIDGDDLVVLHADDEVMIQSSATDDAALQVLHGVNAHLATSWIEDMIIFHNDDFQTVLQNLSRSYDVEIRAQGSVPTQKFYGRFSLKQPLKALIEQLGFGAHVDIVQQDQHRVTVTISP
jgi:transmembrane sensor